MKQFYCKQHGVRLEEREDTRGHITRKIIRTLTMDVYTRPQTNCALMRMVPPRAIARGERYANSATGRDAYSACDIEEVSV